MSISRPEPINGKNFERFFTDFARVYNLCGGLADNIYFPVDYFLQNNGVNYWIELKEVYSENPFFYPDVSIRRLNQIKFLFQQAQQPNNQAGILLHLVHWQKIGARSALLYFDAKLLNKSIQSGKPLHYSWAHSYSLYAMLSMTPNFHKVFQNIEIQKRPFLTLDFPKIENYQDPKFSILKIFD